MSPHRRNHNHNSENMISACHKRATRPQPRRRPQLEALATANGHGSESHGHTAIARATSTTTPQPQPSDKPCTGGGGGGGRDGEGGKQRVVVVREMQPHRPSRPPPPSQPPAKAKLITSEFPGTRTTGHLTKNRRPSLQPHNEESSEARSRDETHVGHGQGVASSRQASHRTCNHGASRVPNSRTLLLCAYVKLQPHNCVTPIVTVHEVHQSLRNARTVCFSIGFPKALDFSVVSSCLVWATEAFGASLCTLRRNEERRPFLRRRGFDPGAHTRVCWPATPTR